MAAVTEPFSDSESEDEVKEKEVPGAREGGVIKEEGQKADIARVSDHLWLLSFQRNLENL